MSSPDPKQQENQEPTKRQGGNLETKGASHELPSRPADESSGDDASRPSGEKKPSRDKA